MPELPDPSLAWEDLSAEDRRALTELLVDKIGPCMRLGSRSSPGLSVQRSSCTARRKGSA